MAREFGRNARVSSQMQKELSVILQRNIDDSRLGFITINEVEVTKDLAVAKVYVTVLNVDEQGKRANVKLLNELSPVIRHTWKKAARWQGGMPVTRMLSGIRATVSLTATRAL